MNIEKEQQALEEHREIFKKLACFTAPSALGKSELSQSILDNLVEHVLYLQKNAISLNKILELIKFQFKLNFEFNEIRMSLDRLLVKKLIIKNNGNFSLEMRHSTLLQKTVNEKIIQENQIFQKFEDHIKEQNPELTVETIKIIRSDFQLFLTNFFLLSGAEAVRLIYGNPKEINNLIGKVQKKNIFELLPAREELIMKIEQKEFCNFVNLLSEQEKLYLQDLLDRSLQYFTITVDKKCEALLINGFAGWSMFVDTNFIYNLLGFNNVFSYSRKKNIEEILELGKKAKIRFFVSPVTIDEFTTSISRVKDILLSDKISRKLYKIAGDVTDNAILSAYYNAYDQQNISPKDFLAKIDNIKDILKLYGIEEKTEYSKSIKETEEFVNTVKQLMDITHKEKIIAEHDAFHYLLILKLRNRERADNVFETNKSWFLTHDGSLASFDYEIRKLEIVFCMKPYQLCQLLRPIFSRVDDFEHVFIDFVTEPVARAFPAVSADIAMNVLARISYFEKDFGAQNSPELATKILTNQHFLNQLREFRDNEKEQIKFIDKEIMQVAQITDDKIEERTQKPAVIIVNNYWNFVNPFWLLWRLLKCLRRLLDGAWKWIRRHITKILIGVIITVVGGIILSLIL